MPATAIPRYIEEIKNRPIDNMISPLVESPTDITLSKILGLLRDRGVYEVFLPEGTRCGMISERELLKATNVETTKISAMITYIPTLPKEASVGEAARLMTDYRIRAAPISDGRKITGQVNCVDLLKELKGRIGGDLRITSLAASDPITIDEYSPVTKARELFVRKRIDHLPVTNGKRLVGLITSTHIISLLNNPERVGSKSMQPQTKANFDFPTADAMDRNPLSCPPDTAAEQALSLMLDNAKTGVLVTQWEELQAIATQRDFMTLLAEVEPEPEVPVFMVGLPEDPFESEATKAKFNRIIRQLNRVFPDILEARSIIKSKHKAGTERGRYEVTVQIRTPRDSFSYSEEGWELPLVYDLITDRLKRLMTKKQKPRRRRERETAEQS
jgi:CBS domain-containing protein/ribosome-associated translation inhibitor RaiA